VLTAHLILREGKTDEGHGRHFQDRSEDMHRLWKLQGGMSLGCDNPYVGAGRNQSNYHRRAGTKVHWLWRSGKGTMRDVLSGSGMPDSCQCRKGRPGEGSPEQHVIQLHPIGRERDSRPVVLVARTASKASSGGFLRSKEPHSLTIFIVLLTESWSANNWHMPCCSPAAEPSEVFRCFKRRDYGRYGGRRFCLEIFQRCHMREHSIGISADRP